MRFCFSTLFLCSALLMSLRILYFVFCFSFVRLFHFFFCRFVSLTSIKSNEFQSRKSLHPFRLWNRFRWGCHSDNGHAVNFHFVHLFGKKPKLLEKQSPLFDLAALGKRNAITPKPKTMHTHTQGIDATWLAYIICSSKRKYVIANFWLLKL